MHARKTCLAMAVAAIFGSSPGAWAEDPPASGGVIDLTAHVAEEDAEESGSARDHTLPGSTFGLTLGGSGDVSLGEPNGDATTGGGRGEVGIRHYRLRIEPGSGGVIRDEELDVAAQLGGSDSSAEGDHGSITGGFRGRLRLYGGWATGNDGCNFYGTLGGEVRTQLGYDPNSVAPLTGTLSPGAELGLLCAGDSATLMIGPTIAGRFGWATDDNAATLNLGGRARFGWEDSTYVTASGDYTVAGTGVQRTTDLNLSIDRRLGESNWMLGGGLGVTGISERREATVPGTTGEVETTWAPNVTLRATLAF